MSPPILLYVDHLWDSPYVFPVFVALHEKGLAFEARPLDLQRGDQRAADYRARSLTARVPAIDHDGFVLSESLAILEYLEERFPPPAHPRSFPSDVYDRARARQVHGWLRSDLPALRDERPTSSMFYARATTPLSERARAAADKLFDVAERLIPRGEGELFGAFCIADAELAFMLHRLILNGDPVPQRIARYAARVWQRPSVQAFVRAPRPASG